MTRMEKPQRASKGFKGLQRASKDREHKNPLCSRSSAAKGPRGPGAHGPGAPTKKTVFIPKNLVKRVKNLDFFGILEQMEN